MAIATSYNIASNREDVSSGINRIAPEITPMYSMLKKGKAPSAAYSEWVVDDLADPDLTATEEGSDITAFENAGENRTRIGNYLQRKERAWSVSDLQMLVDDAAVANQVAESKAKKLLEHRRDLASVIGGSQDLVAGGGATAAKTRALGSWISNSAQATLPVAADFRTPAASIDATAAASFGEAEVNAVLQSMFSQTGTLASHKLYLGTSLKKEFSEFSRTGSSNGVYRQNEDASSNKVTKNVLVYESDFGSLDLVTDLFLARDGTATEQAMRGYIVDPSLVEVAFADGPAHFDGVDEGGGPRGWYKSWFMLKCKNPLGLGKFNATA